MLISPKTDEALKYHIKPVLDLLDDPTITDIVYNQSGACFVYHIDGTSHKVPVLVSGKSIKAVASILAAESSNDVDDDTRRSIGARFQDPPCRVHILMATRPGDGPAFSIRRFPATIMPLEAHVEKGTCTKEQADFLQKQVLARKNIIVSGETGSGKTTFLNSLLSEIPKEDRLYIIEDAEELVPSTSNYVSVTTTSGYTARAAVKDALRMRPDRIIVGEVRDGVALDLIQAWNTGHPGGLCSIHANSADMVKLRLRSLVEMVSVSPQQDLIDATVDIVVQITLCSDGIRRITEIKEFR